MALFMLPFLLLAQGAGDRAALTREALDLILAGKYEPVYALWTPEMQKGMPFEVYKTQLFQLKVLGKPESIGEPVSATVDQFQVVTIPVRWPALTLNFRLSWTKDGRIGGTWFLNPQAAAVALWQHPPYSKPGSFREREVTVGDGEWKLPGTLSAPVGKGPFPAVVLVHGSGPQDRDETILGNKVFKDLAEGLASRGIVVLRYEKRTKVYGAKMAAMKDLTVQQETIEDAVLAAALLRAQPEVDPKRVFVLGHSLGAYAAPRIAGQDPKLAGLILLAGNTRSLEELAREQFQYLGSPEKADALLKSLPAAYMADLNAYDPAAAARKLTLPMLILQGERDYQVSMKDFAGWKKALDGKQNVRLKSYPALNHLFIAGEGKSTPAEYQKPGHVAAEVIDDIAKWLSSST